MEPATAPQSRSVEVQNVSPSRQTCGREINPPDRRQPAPRLYFSRCTYLIAPILKIFVLQTGQIPSVAGRPFFIVICLAFLISR